MVGIHLTRRGLLAALASAPFAGTARAQAAWPDRPVRVMVPYPPVGGADTTARIENRGRAGIAAGRSALRGAQHRVAAEHAGRIPRLC